LELEDIVQGWLAADELQRQRKYALIAVTDICPVAHAAIHDIQGAEDAQRLSNRGSADPAVVGELAFGGKPGPLLVLARANGVDNPIQYPE
jgi:hypothetical protein